MAVTGPNDNIVNGQLVNDGGSPQPTPSQGRDGGSTGSVTEAQSTPDNGTKVSDAEQKQANTAAQDSNPNSLSNGDLPWARVLLPTTSAGQSGLGMNKHGLQPETWVWGFFADGDNSQQPVVVGVIPGGPGAGSAAGGSGGDGGGGGNSPNMASNVKLVGNGNGLQAMNYFVSVGWTPAQAAGIVGNLQQESSVNPVGPSGDSGSAHGIAQWRLGRWTRLQRWSPPSYNTLATQLEYVQYEMKNFPFDTGNAYKHLQNAKTPTDAAYAFVNFEKPRNYRGENMTSAAKDQIDGMRNRISYANQWYQKYSSGGKSS